VISPVPPEARSQRLEAFPEALELPSAPVYNR
jgi:hypothetical protein